MRSKKLVINIISSLILQVVTVITGFIVPKLIISSFGSNVNGLITSITQFLAYITLLESGFGPVLKSTLYKPIANKNKEEIEKILKSSEKFFKTISYIFIIYIVVLSFILPSVVSDEFDTLFTLSLVLIISISTFAEYYFGMTYKLYLQAEQKTYITSIIQIVTTILNTIIIVVLIYIGLNIQLVKLISAIIFVFRPILQNIYVKKKYNLNLKNKDLKYDIKQKWDGLAQHIASVIHTNTDVVILTLFTNTIEVSVYSVYILVVNGIKKLIQALITGIEAAFGDMMAKGEKDNLNKKFKLYEIFYFNIITMIFTCTIILIIPFVKLYTKGITDANYCRPIFAYLIVLAEFVWTIRLPYSSITSAAGHFKETMKGAWVEAIVNVVLSILLVSKFGIVGVAIGTLAAMLIRTIELMYYSSKHILQRNTKIAFKRFAVILIEVILVILVCEIVPNVIAINYLTWAINAFITMITSIIVIVGMNLIVYREDFIEAIAIIKRVFKFKNKE